MKRFQFLPIIAIALTIMTMLAGCEKKGDAQLTGLLPNDATGVVILPNLATTVGDLQNGIDKFSTGPVSTFLTQGKLEITRELGFDPFKPEEWKKLGINPQKGLGFSVDPKKPLIIIGVAQQDIFESELKKRVKELTMAEDYSSTSVQGVKVHSISARIGEVVIPKVHYTFKGGFVLLTAGPGNPDLLAACSNLQPQNSLAQADWYQKLSADLPTDFDVKVIINGKQAQAAFAESDPELAMGLKNGMAAAASLNAGGLSVYSLWGLDAEMAQQLKDFTSGIPDNHLERLLPKDSVLAVKTSVNVQKVLALILSSDSDASQEYSTGFTQLKEMLGADVEKATVRNLVGNFAMGISLGTPEQINRAIASKNEESLAGAMSIFMWLDLKDGAEFRKLLEQALITTGSEFKAKKETIGSMLTVAITVKDDLSIHLLLQGNQAGICTGPDCVQTASQLLSGKGASLVNQASGSIKKIYSQPSILTGSINFDPVIAAVIGLDAAVLGDGGMMVKLILDLAVAAIKNLSEFTLQLQSVPAGVSIHSQLILK